MQAELEHRFDVGQMAEAVVRALIYIRLPEGSVDERGFAMLKLIRASQPAEQAHQPAAVQGDDAGTVPSRLPR